MKRAVVAALCVLLAGCTSTEEFRNNYAHPEKRGFWRWKWEQWRDGLPQRPEGGYRFETVASDLAANPSVTWIGHSTLLVRIGGQNVLTDPQFSERASPLAFAGPKRVVPPAPRLEALPRIDAVLISHNHYDHLDLDSVTRLAQQPGGAPRYFVPLGLKAWFSRQGIENVVELGWWQKQDFNGMEIHLVPVQHWSKRTLFDENQSLWGGWVLRHPQFSFFFAGDAGYSRDFVDIRARFGRFDLAALPIGAYAPRWFMQVMHMDPAEAVRAHRDLNARQSIAIHWGTFDNLTDESLYEPPMRLHEERQKAGLPDDAFLVLKHGETRRLTAH